MDVVQHSGPGCWLEEVSELLYRREAEHSLLLGLAEEYLAGSEPVPEGLGAWSVRDRGQPVGAALVTPNNVIVGRMPDEAVHRLVESLAEQEIEFPGVVGSADTAAAFAEVWSSTTGRTAVLRMRQSLQSCGAVVWRDRAPGVFRAAEIADTSLLVEWARGFEREVHGENAKHDLEPGVRRRIEKERLFVWEDGGSVVTSASIGRPTRSSITVNFVYTPSEHRGRGYATSCVAEVTARQLRAGRQFCCLYTDTSNPISNGVYAKIGYRRVCDSAWWVFEE